VNERRDEWILKTSMKIGSRLILFTTFLLILIAGIVVGRVWQRLPPPLAPGAEGHSWLADQLDLNGEQRQRMDAIWAETRKAMAQSYQKRRALDQQRRQAIVGLLTPEQKAEYDRINQAFSKKRQDLDRQRADLIKQTEVRSRALLNARQRETWDKMNSRWQQRRHRGQWRQRHGTTRPASRPAESARPNGSGPTR
jgi:Spy/CpxP family protein refolding chaperone